MTHAEIVEDFPELGVQDILAALAYASQREQTAKILASVAA
jgi:uncharacterized protein (DUF433 family)